MRGLRCPEERVLHLLFQKRIVDIVTLRISLMVYLCCSNHHVITDLGSRRIIKPAYHIPVPDIRIRIHRNDRTNTKSGILIIGIQFCTYSEVANSHLRLIQEEHLTMNS